MVKAKAICGRETKRQNKLAVDSGGQIKVLRLNGIVGQMTRHRCLSAHSHPLAPQKNIPPPPLHPATFSPFIHPSPQQPSICLKGESISSSVTQLQERVLPYYYYANTLSQSITYSTYVMICVRFLEILNHHFNLPSIKKHNKSSHTNNTFCDARVALDPTV